MTEMITRSKGESLREKFYQLIKEREEALNVNVLSHTQSLNGDIHLICYRASDETYIVWTTYRTEGLITSYNGFYNGHYDMKTAKEALLVAERRANMKRFLPWSCA